MSYVMLNYDRVPFAFTKIIVKLQKYAIGKKSESGAQTHIDNY